MCDRHTIADLIKLCARNEPGSKCNFRGQQNEKKAHEQEEAAAKPEETKDEALKMRLAALGANQFSGKLP